MCTSENKELFETMPVAKAVGTMAIPTIMGQLIVLIYSIADTFFIGRTNNPCMVAGASLILPAFNIAIPISSIAGVGGGSLISRLLGEYQSDEAKKVFSFSVYLEICLAVLFSVLTLLFMKPLLYLLGANSDTYDFARDYAVCVIVFGALPTILSNALSNLIRSVGESKKAGFGIMLGGITNLFLDPLFMFVILPKGNETLGAGIATLISNCISCLYFFITVRKLSKSTVLVITNPTELPKRQSIYKLFSTGLPAAITTFLCDINYVIVDKLLSSYSYVALAAIGIVMKAERLPLNVGIGICQGMVPIVAYNYSAKNYERMQKVTRFSLMCGLICAAISITLYEIFAPYVMRFFIGDAATVALGTGFLRARCLATIFMFLSFFHVHLFNSYGRGRESLFLGVMRWLVFNIPTLLLFNTLFGMDGIVWSQLVADFFTVLLSVIIHRRFSRFVNSPQVNRRLTQDAL